jgi:hypothetical protein
MKYQFVAILSGIAGIALTVLSVYLTNFYTPSGVIFRGYPFYWLTQGTIGPNSDYGKYGVSWMNFTLDLLAWAVAPFIILITYVR